MQRNDRMNAPFLDSTTMAGQRQIRSYVLGWLERLDYGGKLDRRWPADELGCRIWRRVAQDFRSVLADAPVVNNTALAEVSAAVMVEDYLAAYPQRRASRYEVAGPLGDATFRRCVMDFIHDLEEYEPDQLPQEPGAAAEAFWADVEAQPHRYELRPERGPLVDDETRARTVALEAVWEYFDLRTRAVRAGIAC